MTHTKRIIRVAVAGPMRRHFSYHLSENTEIPAPGQRVLVPFGRVKKIGYYLGPGEEMPGIKTRAVVDVLDGGSYFPKDLFKLCVWMSDYYFANPADCLAAALPSLVRSRHAAQLTWKDAESRLIPDEVRHLAKPRKKLSTKTVSVIRKSGKSAIRKLIKEGVITEEWGGDLPEKSGRVAGYTLGPEGLPDSFFRDRRTEDVYFDGMRTRAELVSCGWSEHYIRKAAKEGFLKPVFSSEMSGVLEFVSPRSDVANLTLTGQQQSVFDEVSSHLNDGFKPFLLHGVTGSGKTIVYCHLARKLLEQDKTMLVLTPEITLSGSILAYFRGFFGDKVTVLHSAMTTRERLESWNGIRSGKYKIVVGPRSALFAPLENIGLIVVDEEHDGSYKQDDPSPRFHGRDSAIMRAKYNDIPVLLGSATPSVESYNHALAGRYQLLELTERPGEAVLPNVRIVDMRKDRIAGDMSYLSLPLKNEVSKTIKAERQVILYINRRGYSPFIKCQDCGDVPQCPRCNVKLTYHRAGRKLSCHYCGHVQFADKACSKCGSEDLAFMGAGTQKVEENLPRLFDGIRQVRFDSDTASGRQNAHRILSRFADRKYDLLLGTQMVTKGLDLSGVSLVGVLAADFELDLPDFRSSERTFAKLVQVAGRSGRSDNRGEVLIQTYYPELDLIVDASRQDYRSFFDREIKSREEYDYPPYVRLVNFVVSGTDQKTVESSVDSFIRRMHEWMDSRGLRLQVLGPVPCPLSYLAGKHRRHFFIKTKKTQRLVRMLTEWESEEPRFGLSSKVKIVIDVDPNDMM